MTVYDREVDRRHHGMDWKALCEAARLSQDRATSSKIVFDPNGYWPRDKKKKYITDDNTFTAFTRQNSLYSMRPSTFLQPAEDLRRTGR